MKFSIKILILLLAITCVVGIGSATDGDASRSTPSDANVTIDEPNDQIFTAAIENADPTNKTFSILWYQDSVLIQTTSATNATSDTWTFEGGSQTSGTYNITAITNASGTSATWTLTVNNKLFSGITDVVVSTVGILPDVVDLVVGIVPVLVTLAIIGLITGIFSAIILTIKGRF